MGKKSWGAECIHGSLFPNHGFALTSSTKLRTHHDALYSWPLSQNEPFLLCYYCGSILPQQQKEKQKLSWGHFTFFAESERLPLKTISLYSNLCRWRLKKMRFQCSVNKNSWKQALSAERDGLIRMPHYGKIGMLTPSLPPPKGPKPYLILG